MRVYMAALYSNGYMPPEQTNHVKLTEHEQKIFQDCPDVLQSYHYAKTERVISDMYKGGTRVFLDSGAYSAYTLGDTITLQEYTDWILRHHELIRVDEGIPMVSVLDEIGNADKTYQNQLAMEALGIPTLPCFHTGEDERYLEYYVANYEYITLGGLVGSSTKQLCVWLDRIWERYLVDGAGYPKVKVHGFGITAIPIMEKYPWWSVDSSSWIQTAIFGGILTPDKGQIVVSGQSPFRHDLNQHITTLSQIEREYLFKMLEAQGFTYERLSNSYQSRAAYNTWSFGVIGEKINAKATGRFKSERQELF